MTDDVEVPDEFYEWPFETRKFVLAEANGAIALREAIDGIVGLDSDNWRSEDPGHFKKQQLAALLMALGGPDDG